MRKISVLTAMAMAGGLAASAQAASVTLPSADKIQVETVSIFSTNFIPQIDVSNGTLQAPSGPVTVNAYGVVTQLIGSSLADTGSISGQLTYTFSGNLVTKAVTTSPTIPVDSTVSQLEVTIVSNVENGKLQFFLDDGTFFDPVTLYGDNPNSAASQAELAKASDGELFLEATPSTEDLISTITIQFKKLSAASTGFDAYKIIEQNVTANNPTEITDGSILDMIDGGTVDGGTVSQVEGIPVTGFLGFTPVDGLSPASLDQLQRLSATFTINVDHDEPNIIPEPASASLLCVAGVMLLARRRNSRMA